MVVGEEQQLLSPPLFWAGRRGCVVGHTAPEQPQLADRRSEVCTEDLWGDTDRSSGRSPGGLVSEQGWWEVEEAGWW